MEQERNNKSVIALLVVIIIILLSLVVLLATETISFKSDNAVHDTKGNNTTVTDTKGNTTTVNDKVSINLSIGNVTVSKDAPNAKISVDGTIDLSYDNSKYIGVTLSGYCLGTDNEKYLIHGPGDGGALFHNGNNSLTLTEDIPQNIEYSDGTVKAWSEIDWNNVKIKYCKIEKMTAILNDGSDGIETVLDVEKEFK